MSVRSYKIELKLNKKQTELCFQSAGTARFAYNWKLKHLIDNYEQAKKDAEELGLSKVSCKLGSSIDWHKEWVVLKKDLTWITKTSKCCGQEALRDLEKAFKRFFAKKSGYPNFKKRGQKDSFRLTSNIRVGPDWITLPKLGKVKLKEKGYAVQDGVLQIGQATVKRQADRWFVSFIIDDGVPDSPLPDLSLLTSSEILGLDLGLKDLGISSDGQVFENPKAYKKHLKRLKRYQRRVSRKKKGSNNRKKATTKLSRVHRKISNIREDATHKLTSSLVKTKPKMIVIESLKPKNMSKNHKLAGSILDAAFGTIKTQLVYKCKRDGIWLVQAPQFYASSKFCSRCGWKYTNLSLSEREWSCQKCGANHDRDVNAALNLRFFAEWILELNTGSSPEIDACGDERLQFLQEQCSSTKQEFKSKHSLV